MDFIPPGDNNSFVVIICALGLFGVDTNVTECYLHGMSAGFIK